MRPMPWREHIPMIFDCMPVVAASMIVLKYPMRPKSSSPETSRRLMSAGLVTITGVTVSPGGANRCHSRGEDAWFLA